MTAYDIVMWLVRREVWEQGDGQAQWISRWRRFIDHQAGCRQRRRRWRWSIVSLSQLIWVSSDGAGPGPAGLGRRVDMIDSGRCSANAEAATIVWRYVSVRRRLDYWTLLRYVVAVCLVLATIKQAALIYNLQHASSTSSAVRALASSGTDCCTVVHWVCHCQLSIPFTISLILYRLYALYSSTLKLCVMINHRWHYIPRRQPTATSHRVVSVQRWNDSTMPLTTCAAMDYIMRRSHRCQLPTSD